MQVRLVSRVVVCGLLAYVCIPLAVVIGATVLLNLPIIPQRIMFVGTPILYFILRFALFMVIGLIVGRKSATARIANAVLAGVLLSIGVMFLDTMGIFILARFHSRPDIPVAGHSGGPFMGIWWPLAWFGLQVVLATVGGWMANRRQESA